MAKILISFVGTGPLKSEGSEREYKTANYHLEENDLGEYPFVAAALSQYHKVDKVILVGTVHSMWEEVYRYFCEQNNQELDEDAFFKIAEHCSKATHESDLIIPHKDKIEKAIGNDSHIMLIRYGLNEKEITENISIILGLNELINTGDEIIVDVTHAFRSLPIFIMNLLLYLTNVSNKKPEISHIYYGMLEMQRSLPYAPIVDLKKILDLNKWIVGASAFKKYGNAYQISELVQDTDKDLGYRLKRFSDLLNLNHLDMIEKEVSGLQAMKNKIYNDPLAELTVKPVLNEFLKTFRTSKDNHALFQYKLAKWQYDNMNYALSLISLTEAIVTYACNLEKRDWNNRAERDCVKDSIYNRQSQLPNELSKCYKRIAKVRNSVAHSKQNKKSHITIINDLKEALEIAGKYIQYQPSEPF